MNGRLYVALYTCDPRKDPKIELEDGVRTPKNLKGEISQKIQVKFLKTARYYTHTLFLHLSAKF